MTEKSKEKAHRASYFEWLYQADPPVIELDIRVVTIPIADHPFNCEPPLFVETGCGEPVESG